MTFSVVLFVLSWAAFLLFAKKELFFKVLPTCYVAMVLGLSTDILTDSYGLWEYPAATKVQTFWRHILDDFGIYFVITYLFVQTLPKAISFWKMAWHVFLWSLLAIVVEFVAIKTGNLKHQLWWNLWCSYVADWLLYLIFFAHHKWRISHPG